MGDRQRGGGGAGLLHALAGLVGVVALLGALGVYALYVEPRRLEVTHPVLPVADLPPALDGLTIAHLSDPHVGSEADAAVLERSVALVNALNPDLVVLTGDFCQAGEHAQALLAREVGGLRARLGVYAVLGNHDVWLDAGGVAETLAGAGVQVLRDEAVAAQVGEARLWLLGLDDSGYSGFSGRTRDLEVLRRRWAGQVAAYERLQASLPPGEPRLLLVHNPDLNEFLSGEALAALCGHTHGGQVRLPLYGPLYLPSAMGTKYAGGWAGARDWPVYVSRGLGANGMNVRFHCRPEVTLLTLRAGAGAPEGPQGLRARAREWLQVGLQKLQDARERLHVVLVELRRAIRVHIENGDHAAVA